MHRKLLEDCGGILRLMPNFVAYKFNKPGFRLKLHPDDYYALGMENGAIKERLLASVMPGRASAIEGTDFTLQEVVETLGADILGQDMYEKHGTFPIHAKFFDYGEPLFHHLHLDFESAARIGIQGKPEAYYFPAQMNNHPGTFPHTYFGFDPTTTKDMVRDCIRDFSLRDTRITQLSRAFRLQLGTGWYVPPGVLHAPGSYLTYEPQWNSSSGAVFENVTAGEVNTFGAFSSSCPEGKKDDLDYIMSLIDWEKNIDPNFKETYFRQPITRHKTAAYEEKWITYNNPYFSATELTIQPGETVTITDDAPYGCVFVQGHGRFGNFTAETPTLIRFGQPTADEYFVSYNAAKAGVVITNASTVEPMVILKHFAVDVKVS